MVGQTCSIGGAIKGAGGEFPTTLHVKRWHVIHDVYKMSQCTRFRQHIMNTCILHTVITCFVALLPIRSTQFFKLFYFFSVFVLS